MDYILSALIVISILMLVYGIYTLFLPSRYQNNGKICEKNTMSTCPSIKNDYYIIGTAMIILSLTIGGLVLFEMSRNK